MNQQKQQEQTRQTDLDKRESFLLKRDFDGFNQTQLDGPKWTQFHSEIDKALAPVKDKYAPQVYDGIRMKIEKDLIHESRLFGMKIDILDVSPKDDYNFTEFFYNIRKGIISYKSGVGDVIHSIIMKNNAIDHILTFDGKDDFKAIPGFKVLHPKDVKF